MTTGFGFCPQCGTPRIAADQRFCAKCGNDLSALVAAPPAPPAAAAPPAPAAPPAAPVPPPPAAPQPAAAVPSQPPTPPAWSVAPTQLQPVAPPPWSVPSPGAATPAATTGPAKPLVTIGSVNVTPKMAAIAGIALAAIIVVVYFVSSGSKSGGITVTPSTYSCSSTALVTAVMRLPASVQATEVLVFQQDGKTVDTAGATIHVSDLFTHQTDGSWTYTSSDQAKSNCTGSSGETLTMGTHTIAILDVAGHVLAQGSFTLTP